MSSTASSLSPRSLDDADRLDRRQADLRERAQQRYSRAARRRRQLLERVQRAVVVDEADDVAVDAARDLDEPRRLPLRERHGSTAGRGSPGGRSGRRGGRSRRPRAHTPRSMRGAIAAGHPVTAEVGARVLAEGGNAVDAAVAAGVRVLGDGVAAHRPGRRRLHARPPRARPLDAAARLLRHRAERRLRPRDDERRSTFRSTARRARSS